MSAAARPATSVTVVQRLQPSLPASRSGSPKAKNHRHAGIGYVTSDDEHGEAIRKPRQLAWNKPGSPDLPDTEPNEETRAHRDPADAVIHRRSLSESQKHLR